MALEYVEPVGPHRLAIGEQILNTGPVRFGIGNQGQRGHDINPFARNDSEPKQRQRDKIPDRSSSGPPDERGSIIPWMIRIGRQPYWTPAVGCCWAILGVATSAGADVFHLKGGDEIVCDILEDRGDSYRVRVLSGIADIEKDRIVKHDRTPSPWRRYQARCRRTKDTAEAHYRLAQWCRKNGLRPEEREQLQRVIELDPDHAAARQALGYVAENGAWIRPRSPNAPTKEELEARRAARREEQLVRQAVSQWFLKIKAIYRGRLSGPHADPDSEKFKQGRHNILIIDDPLALPALTGVLCRGETPTRRVLVEALAQFPQDEATLNLIVISLLDPAPEIRRFAAQELLKREDPRITEHLRRALASDEEPVLRHAAVTLGILRARSVVEDLIAALSITTRRTVRISRPVYLQGLWGPFSTGYRCARGNRLLYYRPDSIGVLGSGTMIGTDTRYERRTVSIYRTEVQDALIAITGQNFGFDADAWRRWWRKQEI